MVLEVPNNSLTCMQGQKTHLLSYNTHLFLPYLLNDSQTRHSTIHFSKPLLCVTLICGDWSDWSYFHLILPVMPDKAAFVSAVLLCVQRYQANKLFYLQKRHLVAKKEFAFSFRPTRKDQQVGGQYANVSCLRSFLIIRTNFNDSESTLSFERQ